MKIQACRSEALQTKLYFDMFKSSMQTNKKIFIKHCTLAVFSQPLQGNISEQIAFILDKIIVGSYHGILRIFMPRTAEFKAEDLMLEIQMTQPILQVEAGHFVSLVSKQRGFVYFKASLNV